MTKHKKGETGSRFSDSGGNEFSSHRPKNRIFLLHGSANWPILENGRMRQPTFPTLTFKFCQICRVYTETDLYEVIVK